MIDFSKPVQTRDGRKVEIITTNGRGLWTVVGYVGNEAITRHWRGDGASFTERQNFDLINVPEPRMVYLRAYCDGSVSASNNNGTFDCWGLVESSAYGTTNDYTIDLTDPDAPKIERVTK